MTELVDPDLLQQRCLAGLDHLGLGVGEFGPGTVQLTGDVGELVTEPIDLAGELRCVRAAGPFDDVGQARDLGLDLLPSLGLEQPATARPSFGRFTVIVVDHTGRAGCAGGSAVGGRDDGAGAAGGGGKGGATGGCGGSGAAAGGGGAGGALGGAVGGGGAGALASRRRMSSTSGSSSAGFFVERNVIVSGSVPARNRSGSRTLARRNRT
jgi:hypothetical protein